MCCKELDVNATSDRSFASEGHLLTTLSKFLQMDECCKVSIDSLINTLYKNEDKTPN